MLRDSVKRFGQFKALARTVARDPQGLLTTQQTNTELLPSDAEFLDQLALSQAALATNPPVGSDTTTNPFQPPAGTILLDRR